MFSNGNEPNAPLLSVRNQYQDPRPFATPPGVRMALVSIQDIGNTGGKGISVSPRIDPAAADLVVSMLRAASSPVPAASASRHPAPSR